MPKADVFTVYGSPPKAVMGILSIARQRALKRYVEKLTGRIYRIGYDCGAKRVEELRKERDDLRRRLAAR